MPMKTVDNRTNAPPLDHVGVINETAELTREETRLGYPSVIQHSWLMLPGCFAEYWRHFCLFEARSPSEKPACWNVGKIYIVARILLDKETKPMVYTTLFILKNCCISSDCVHQHFLISLPLLSFKKAWKIKMTCFGNSILQIYRTW